LRTRAERKSRLEIRQKVLEAVVNISQIDYPPVLEEREIDSLLRDEARRLGYRELEDYLKRVNKTEEELKEKLRPIARKRVTNTLVLDKVAEVEKIEINASEVNNKVAEIAENTKDKEKMQQFLALPPVRESIGESLRTEKTVERLVQIASGSQGKTEGCLL
jgi:trigger factor